MLVLSSYKQQIQVQIYCLIIFLMNNNISLLQDIQTHVQYTYMSSIVQKQNSLRKNTASKIEKNHIIIQYMSSTKIKRLKTPLKSRTPQKYVDSTYLSHHLNQQSTISLIKQGSWSQSLQATLIIEINKLYKQIASVKDQNKRTQEINDVLTKNSKELQLIVVRLTQEINQFKEKYQLQITNHQQLRKFYQQRQLQWIFIINEHRKLLQQYDRINGTSLSKIHQPSSIPIIYQQTNKAVQNQYFSKPSQYKSEHFVESSSFKRQPRSLKKNSLQRKDNSVPKLRILKEKQSNQQHYYRQLSRLYSKESEFAMKSDLQKRQLLTENEKLKNIQKNPEIDDFFDKVLRKTYYKYKERCISVCQIENMDDMIKLKNANTSTRQRLAKTIRKLNFQIANDYQLKVICQFVQKAVISKYKVLKVDKLKECQKLALSSDSQLQRLDKERSNVKDSMIVFESPKTFTNFHDFGISNLALSSKKSSVLEKISQRNLQLMLNSTIKNNSASDHNIIDEKSSSHSKFSLFSQKNLSDLIRVEPCSKGNDEKLLKYGIDKMQTRPSRVFL